MSDQQNTPSPKEDEAKKKRPYDPSIGPFTCTVAMTGRHVHVTCLPLFDGLPEDVLYIVEEQLCRAIAPMWWEILEAADKVKRNPKSFHLITDHGAAAVEKPLETPQEPPEPREGGDKSNG